MSNSTNDDRSQMNRDDDGQSSKGQRQQQGEDRSKSGSGQQGGHENKPGQSRQGSTDQDNDRKSGQESNKTNPGNFANDREKASEAGRKGGQS